MDPTLTTAGHLLLATIWAALSVTLALVFPEARLLPVVGAVFGAVAGTLRARAIDANPGLFAAAKTLREVRDAFRTTRPGNAAIAIQWFAAASIVLVTFLVARQTPFAAFMAGYGAFMLVREIVSLPATRRLNKALPS